MMHTTNILGIAQASNSQLNAMVRSAAAPDGCESEGLDGVRGARCGCSAPAEEHDLPGRCPYSLGPLKFLCFKT